MSTIQDVAAKAGCAISTVSRVLNGSPHTTAEMRERVHAAALELDYTVNAIGRSLKTKQTRALGVLIPSLTNPVFASSLAGIEEAARAVGFDIIVTTSNYERDRDGAALAALKARGVEGVLATVTDPDDGAMRDRLAAAALPTVFLYNQPGIPGIAAVTVDNVAATRDLTQEALRLGHKRIGYVSGRFGSSDRARWRHRGYCEAMDAAGLEPAAAVEVPFLGSDAEFAAAVAAVVSTRPRPTALLCSNDLLAIRIIDAARTLGLSVPGDVAVAGFDGIDIGRMIAPSLATIVQPAEAMGREAATLLFALMDGRAQPTTLLMPHQFRPGASLAAARDDHTGALRAAPHPSNGKTDP